MKSTFPFDDDPTWTLVSGVNREQNGMRLVFNTERSGEFSYLVPWTAPVFIEGESLAVSRYVDLAELAISKYARLTFDDLAHVIRAEFCKEIPE